MSFSSTSVRGLASAVVLVVGLTSGCGAAPTASHNKVDDPSAAGQSSSTPTAAPESPESAELPPNFIGTMARHGYVLTNTAANDGVISGDAAIEQARQTFPLFQVSDPSVATYFLVSTPRGGRLKDVTNPDSDVKPDLDKTPMWVVYAQADMLKDDSDPSLGWVRGTVVVFVDATTGQAEQAITY